MGSATTYSRLEAFGENFGERLEREYRHLIGRTVTGISNFSMEYFKFADIALDNGIFLSVHFGWASEEEYDSGEETLESDELSTVDYINKYVVGQKIVKIECGYERDDMFYIYAKTENGYQLEIPYSDFNVHDFELYDFSIISEDEFKAFEEQYFSEI